MRLLTLFLFSFLISHSSCRPDDKRDNLNTDGTSLSDGSNQLVNKLLQELAGPAQVFTVPSSKKSTITGNAGTVIHIDPNSLEKEDGNSPVGKIDIQLIEMTDKSSLIYNDAQTASNGLPLVTGGAYYINMSEHGSNLQIKKGKALQVEFPSFSDESMTIFNGSRDTDGAMNWTKTNGNLVNKIGETKYNISSHDNALEEGEEDFKIIETFSFTTDPINNNIVIDTIAHSIDTVWGITKDEHEIIEKAIPKDIEDIIHRSKTYQAIEILELGWINCDRFLNDPEPLVNINFNIESDTVLSAKIFAVFDDINSILSTGYNLKRNIKPVIQNIPTGRKIRIIALAASNQKSLYFEKDITSGEPSVVEISFTEMDIEDIKEKIEQIN